MPDPHIHHLSSDILGRKRKVRVWIPDDIDASRPHPVLYQQDGQLAFSDRNEELPFGSWGVDVWLEKLAASGAFPHVIVIGIDNSPKRMKEYFPFTEEFADYQGFLTEELVPWVEAHYPVTRDRKGCALMGSSMGGLVSFALAANNPDLFGACACLSPWFEYDDFRYVRQVLRHADVKPPLRVYMDAGIHDWRGLDDGHRGMLMARLELHRLGFRDGVDLDWMVDTFFPGGDDLSGSLVKPEKREEARHNQHNEYQWNRRLERPLRFLFGGWGA